MPSKARQEIRYCTTSDGVRLAYATTGNGPPLVKASNWLTHLDFEWGSPIWRHWYAELSRHHRLVRYDERGNGMSQRDVDYGSLDVWVQDLETVVDAAGLDRFPLLGISRGGSIAIAYAVKHAERVTHLVLHGAFAAGVNHAGTPQEIEAHCALASLLRLGWGLNNPAFCKTFTSRFIPEATPEHEQWFDALLNLLYCEYMLGRYDVCDALLPDLEAATSKSGHSGAAWLAMRVRSNISFLRTGDIREFLTQAEQSLEAPQFRYLVRTYVGQSRLYLGEVDLGLEQLEMVITEQPSGHYSQGVPEGNLFAALALAGETRRAEALIDRVTDLLPIPKRRNLHGRFLALDGLVTGLTLLGDRTRCGQLYPLTEDYILTGAVSANLAVGPSNPQLAAALAADAAGLTGRARDHFETALCQARDAPVRVLQPMVLYWYGRAMARTTEPAETARGHAMVEAAMTDFRALGMVVHAGLAARWLREERGR